MTSMDDIIHPQRALKQPRPKISQGGDCWACVIGGITGLTVQQVYDDLNEGKQAASIGCIESILCTAESMDLIKWFYNETPYWPPYDGHRTFGDPAIIQRLGWISWVHMALLSGHVGYASVAHNGISCIPENCTNAAWIIGGRTNHAVMICGIRERSIPHKTVECACNIEHEILVSCSASHPEGKWINVNKFLVDYGGFNTIWVMPK